MSADEKGSALELMSKEVLASGSLLRLGESESKIRIVNASDRRVEFALTTGGESQSGGIHLEPADGHVAPRDFVTVILRRSKRFDVQNIKLRLAYWHIDLTRRKRVSAGHLVEVRLTNEKADRGRDSLWFVVMKIFRSSLFAAIVVYNLFLIKVYTYSKN